LHRQQQQGNLPAQQQQQQQQHLIAPSLPGYSDSRSDTSSSRQQLAGQLPASRASGGLAAGQLRLALPVQQRGASKAAVRQLRQQLATAEADLRGVACLCVCVSLSVLRSSWFLSVLRWWCVWAADR
jgi:hypothetical protein